MNRINNDKRGVVVLVTVSILMVVGIVSFVVVSDWFYEFQTNWNSKNEYRGNVGELEILDIKMNGSSQSYISIRNSGNSYHIVSDVRYDGSSCTILNSNVILEIDRIYLNCSVTINSNYEVVVLSDKGIFMKTLTVYS